MKSRYSEFTILIPCFNEEQTIGTVLVNMLSLNPGNIVVVDDGSTDKSAEIIRYLQEYGPITLVQNQTNSGAGGALQRGFDYCRKLDTKYIVTVDADNQHSRLDTKKIMDATLKSQGLIVSGKRKFSEDVPWQKKIGNFGAALTFRFLYDLPHPDPLCGLRAYHKSIVGELQIESGFDWPVTVNRVIKKYYDYCQIVDIEAIYTAYSLSKGNTLGSAVGLFWKMISTRVTELLGGFTLDDVASEFVLPDFSVNMPARSYKPLSSLNYSAIRP